MNKAQNDSREDAQRVRIGGAGHGPLDRSTIKLGGRV